MTLRIACPHAQVRSAAQMLEFAQGKRAGEVVVDARSLGRFVGTEPEPRAGLKGGHIPGGWWVGHKHNSVVAITVLLYGPGMEWRGLGLKCLRRDPQCLCWGLVHAQCRKWCLQ